MSLTFSQVVACNNITALKSFTTFLFNYKLHDKPSFLHKAVIKSAEKWIELRARKEFIELKAGLGAVNMKLNDCQTSMFTILYLANQKDLTFGSGKELFQAIATTELEFEKLKHPKSDASYSQAS